MLNIGLGYLTIVGLSFLGAGLLAAVGLVTAGLALIVLYLSVLSRWGWRRFDVRLAGRHRRLLA